MCDWWHPCGIFYAVTYISYLCLQLANSSEQTAVGTKLMEFKIQPTQIFPVYIRYCPSAVEQLKGKMSIRPLDGSAMKYSVSRFGFVLTVKCFVVVFIPPTYEIRGGRAVLESSDGWSFGENSVSTSIHTF